MLRIVSTSLALQGLTLASKSLLLFVLARYLSAAQLGLFGIVTVTLTLAMHVAGLDFYAYATREILARPRRDVPRLVRDQLVFHALGYLVVLPALVLLFAGGILPPPLFAVFLVLVVLEHAAQELHRLLVTLERPVEGAVLFFIRGGSWIYALVILVVLDPAARSVRAVCLVWILGVLASVVLGGVWLRDLPWRGITREPVDWGWIRRGIGVSLPLLTASFALRAILALDRYVLQHFDGEAAVGVYTFYASVRNAMQGFFDMGVLFILRPKIIAAYQAGREAEYCVLMRRLSWSLGGLSVALCLAAVLLVRPVLAFVGQPIYAEHLRAYWIVIAMAVVMAAGEIPHTVLYARRQDAAIVRATFLGLLAAVTLNLLLVPAWGIEGAALATLLAGGVIGVAKALSLRGGSRCVSR